MSTNPKYLKDVNALRDLLAQGVQSLPTQIATHKLKNNLAGVWIPLDVSFPPHDLEVLLYLSRNTFMVGYWNHAFDDCPAQWLPAAVGRKPQAITHWMVIPTAPDFVPMKAAAIT